MNKLAELLCDSFGVSQYVYDLVKDAEKSLSDQFEQAEKISEYNQLKVLNAMQKNRLSDIHFASTNGYGYNDLGRDVLESVYADVFRTEDALVRPQMISGTHALTVCFFGNLRPGDELLSVTGKPYDTLEGVIGIKPTNGSLKDYGITYKQVDLIENGDFDYDKIAASISPKTKIAAIQRSKGYAWRESLSVEKTGKLIRFIKNIRKDIICMVDNCYCELVDYIEPTEVGADIVVGSLIKNPGGGLAPIGGYIAGKKEYVENSAARLTAPGLGKEVGPTLGLNSSFLQGLFFAPTVVCGCVKGALLTAKVFENLGFETLPKSDCKRVDIVQAIKLNSEKNIISFCEGIQKSAPVDSFVSPVPNYMPGYENDVIMAAGAFVQGSSIELSADAPIRPPFVVYMQGGLTYYHIKAGIMLTAEHMKLH